MLNVKRTLSAAAIAAATIAGSAVAVPTTADAQYYNGGPYGYGYRPYYRPYGFHRPYGFYGRPYGYGYGYGRPYGYRRFGYY